MGIPSTLAHLTYDMLVLAGFNHAYPTRDGGKIQNEYRNAALIRYQFSVSMRLLFRSCSMLKNVRCFYKPYSFGSLSKRVEYGNMSQVEWVLSGILIFMVISDVVFNILNTATELIPLLADNGISYGFRYMDTGP